MLYSQGYTIIHNTEHTPCEFGKDVIAISPERKLCAYQLKGNPNATLKQREFHEIRGQLEQLSTYALSIPGLKQKTPDECFLVTNGNIDEAVTLEIQQLNISLKERGHGTDRIKTLTRGTLLTWAKEMGTSLWPSEIEDYRCLIQLLNFKGDEIFPAETYDRLLKNTLRVDDTSRLSQAEAKRRIASTALLTSVVLTPFSSKQNYYAEITAWVMFCTYCIALCEKRNINYKKAGQEQVQIAMDGIYDLLAQMAKEINSKEELIEGNTLCDFAFYSPRYLILACLCLYIGSGVKEQGGSKTSIKKLLKALFQICCQMNGSGERVLSHTL